MSSRALQERRAGCSSPASAGSAGCPPSSPLRRRAGRSRRASRRGRSRTRSGRRAPAGRPCARARRSRRASRARATRRARAWTGRRASTGYSRRRARGSPSRSPRPRAGTDRPRGSRASWGSSGRRRGGGPPRAAGRGTSRSPRGSPRRAPRRRADASARIPSRRRLPPGRTGGRPLASARARPWSSSASTAGRAARRGSAAHLPPRAPSTTSSTNGFEQFIAARTTTSLPRSRRSLSTPAACSSVSLRIGDPPPIDRVELARGVLSRDRDRRRDRLAQDRRLDPDHVRIREEPVEKPRHLVEVLRAPRAGERGRPFESRVPSPESRLSKRPGEDGLFRRRRQVGVERHGEVAQKDPPELRWRGSRPSRERRGRPRRTARASPARRRSNRRNRCRSADSISALTMTPWQRRFWITVRRSRSSSERRNPRNVAAPVASIADW